MFLRGQVLGDQDEATLGKQDRLMILAFGRPKQQGSSYGTFLPFDQNYTFQSTSVIANAVKEFARGYWVGTGTETTSHLGIVVGTNNCCNGDPLSLFQGHGTAWAQMMNSLPTMIASYASQVDVVAGSDMELEFNRPYHTAQWLSTLMSASQCDAANSGDNGCLYNFGNQTVSVPTTSAGPCNYTSSTATQWYACDVWYISWGAKKSGDPDPFI